MHLSWLITSQNGTLIYSNKFNTPHNMHTQDILQCGVHYFTNKLEHPHIMAVWQSLFHKQVRTSTFHGSVVVHYFMNKLEHPHIMAVWQSLFYKQVRTSTFHGSVVVHYFTNRLEHPHFMAVWQSTILQTGQNIHISLQCGSPLFHKQVRTSTFHGSVVVHYFINKLEHPHIMAVWLVTISQTSQNIHISWVLFNVQLAQPHTQSSTQLSSLAVHYLYCK